MFVLKGCDKSVTRAVLPLSLHAVFRGRYDVFRGGDASLFRRLGKRLSYRTKRYFSVHPEYKGLE